jgi:pyruvate,water dikinase
MTMFGALLVRTGLPGNFFESVTRDDRAARPRLSYARVALGAPRIAVFLWRHGRAARAIEAFLERHQEELRPFCNAEWNGRPLDGLIAASERLQDLHGDSQWHMFVGAMNMTVRNKLLQRLVQRHAPDVPPGDLTRGLTGLKALEPNLALRRIAASAAQLGPSARTAMKSGHDADVREALAAAEGGPSVARAMDAFVSRFGYLASNGTDFTEPRWNEDPALAWRALARLIEASNHAGAEHDERDAAAARERAQGLVRSCLGPLRRLWFDHLLRSTGAYIDRRERLSAAMTEDAFQARRLFLAIGDRLVERGDLPARDDVFLLYFDEVRALAAGHLEPVVARARARERRAELDTDAAIVPPETFWGEHPPLDPQQVDASDALTGIPGSAGVMQGFACVVHNPADAPASLSPEHVLVVPFTDVGWMPLFASVGGVVAECGGQLSHTAIVAREYGLPTVVGVAGATRRIRDGQALTVDGTHGVVYLKHLRLPVSQEEA